MSVIIGKIRCCEYVVNREICLHILQRVNYKIERANYNNGISQHITLHAALRRVKIVVARRVPYYMVHNDAL